MVAEANRHPHRDRVRLLHQRGWILTTFRSFRCLMWSSSGLVWRGGWLPATSG